MGFTMPKEVPEWMRASRHTDEAIEQAAKLQRQIDEAMGGATGRMMLDLQMEQQRQQRLIDEALGANGRTAIDALERQAKHQQMLKEIGVVSVYQQIPDAVHWKIPDAVQWQQGEERRRLRMAEAEGEAKAKAEFNTRQELEAAQQKELQATAVTVPPPAPASESIADRNARWLTIYDKEKRIKHNGAQTRTIELIFTTELIDRPEAIGRFGVKAALQAAEKDRAASYREVGAVPLTKKKGKPKITANNPFGLAAKKS